MTKRIKRSSQSGIALLLAIFTLMLLSALGLALLGSADLETRIAANYRDKQSSIYASLSGIQEARDRLIPSLCQSGSCTKPGIDTQNLGLPKPSAANVIYILNPDTAHGETSADIKPWAPVLNGKPNPYYDSTLCSTNYFSANLCSGGLPPTTNTWYKTYDDSTSSGGYYTPGSAALPYPMDFKWVRITLKADNMTEMPARWTSGPTNASNGTQMCWQGKYEMATSSGAGFSTACKSGGSILLYYNGVQCNNTCSFSGNGIGSGFDDPTTITIGAPNDPNAKNPVQATATITLKKDVDDGRLDSIPIDNAGSGYKKAPAVTIDKPPSGGTQATAVAQIGGAPIVKYTVTQPSTYVPCYASTPAIDVSGGSGTGATAVADISKDSPCIVGWSVGVASGCSDSAQVTGNPIDVTGVGGSGSGFSGTITFSTSGGAVTGTTITNPGSNYGTPPSSVTASGGKLNNCSLNITWTIGHMLQTVTPVTGGNGYTNGNGLPSVTTAGPTQPSGKAAPSIAGVLGTATNAGTVTAIVLTNPGSGYTTAPNVTLDPPVSGTQAKAHAVLQKTNTVEKITLTDAGNGYISDPSVTVNGGTLPGPLQARATQTTLGKIYVLTSLAVNPGGSKTLSQAEVATPPFVPYSTPAPLVLDNPQPDVTLASSNNYVISGVDADTCGESSYASKPAVGVYDDPSNPTNPSSTACLTSVLGGTTISAANCQPQPGVKSSNYPGAQPSPDVENVYNQLGDLTTPAGVDSLATMIESQTTAQNTYYDTAYPTPLTKLNPTSPPSDCPTQVVYGNLSLNGESGCGVLLVTGNLAMTGNFKWYGPIFVIGYGGNFTAGGSGTGYIYGSLFVAKYQYLVPDSSTTSGYQNNSFNVPQPQMLSQLQPTNVDMYTGNGGGNAYLYYDHCWSDNMMSTLSNPAKSSNPLKVLSLHTMY